MQYAIKFAFGLARRIRSLWPANSVVNGGKPNRVVVGGVAVVKQRAALRRAPVALVAAHQSH